MKSVKPSDLELQTLSVLWKHGPASVRDVLARMPDGKARAYTTILSVLQVMEKKGFVNHTREGLAHIYAPRLTERQATRGLLRGLVEHVFGSPTAVMQNLLAEGHVSDDEARQIQKLIASHLSQGKSKGERNRR